MKPHLTTKKCLMKEKQKKLKNKKNLTINKNNIIKKSINKYKNILKKDLMSIIYMLSMYILAQLNLDIIMPILNHFTKIDGFYLMTLL
jgi:translation initiation factor IF-2